MMNKEIKHIQISAIGIDVHKFSLTKANTIKLGGVSIKHNKKLIGHSDADVVLHALVDSILGTVSEGDIGSIFSNKDPKWKNANSIIFVRHAISLLNKHKCNLLHTDINIICEEPKISIHSNKIKKRLGWYPKTNFSEGINLTLNWYYITLNKIVWIVDRTINMGFSC